MSLSIYSMLIIYFCHGHNRQSSYRTTVTITQSDFYVVHCLLGGSAVIADCTTNCPSGINESMAAWYRANLFEEMEAKENSKKMK